MDRLLEAEAAPPPETNTATLDAAGHLARGIQLLKELGLEAAVAEFTLALTALPPLPAPDLAEAYFQRGACQRMLHRYAEAICDAEYAVGLIPDRSAYHMDLGYARFWANDYAGALADLDRAVALDPANTWAYGYRGRVQAALGLHHQAHADFTTAIQRDETEALFYLWRAQTNAAEGHFAEAEADSGTGLMWANGDARLWSERAWARWGGQVDLEGALRDFNESLRLRPEPLAYLGRGLVQRALGRQADAERDFAQFVNCHPVGPIAALKQLNQALGPAVPLDRLDN